LGRANGHGVDFKPYLLLAPQAADGFTLSHAIGHRQFGSITASPAAGSALISERAGTRP
jgi:L-rhamnose isomerase